MIRSRTVLPDPLPPITTSVSPLSRLKLTPLSTSTVSKLLRTSTASTSALMPSPRRPEEDEEELGEEEVRDDDAHRDLHDGRGGGATEPFRAALDAETVVAADQRDDRAEE